MSEKKYSRQREAIKAYLKQTKEHPSADKVYEEIRKEYPKISLGTVYRNLNLLVEEGEAVCMRFGNAERFDGGPGPHMHYYCRRCEQIFDLPLELTGTFVRKVRKSAPGTVEQGQILLTGLCDSCSEM